MHRPAPPALRGAVVFGAVAAGAVIASQTVSLVSVDSDLAADANTLTAGGIATVDRTVVRPVPELSTLALPRDSAHEVQALAKGLALAEERARPEPVEEQIESLPEPPTGGLCASSGFGGVVSHVARAGHLLQEMFGVEDVIGVASRPGNPTSDHPRGYALDFMVDRSTGDALAAYAEENSEALGVSYILWRVADHYDHVHISFEDDGGRGLLC
ncbi:MAG: hypothetical protein LC799_36330 [Actinobacteria bacterium]|nr:hypothetical protein [Actinomycetota bacterium]